MRTILSHLWKKVQIFLRFSLAHVMPMKWFYAVMFLLVNLPLHNCLNVASFCQIWQDNSGFKGNEFLQVPCIWATELKHICPSRWGRSSRLSTLLWDTHTEREGTKDPAVRKVTKELAQAWGSELPALSLLKLFHKKSFVLSSHLGPRAGVSG